MSIIVSSLRFAFRCSVNIYIAETTTETSVDYPLFARLLVASRPLLSFIAPQSHRFPYTFKFLKALNILELPSFRYLTQLHLALPIDDEQFEEILFFTTKTGDDAEFSPGSTTTTIRLIQLRDIVFYFMDLYVGNRFSAIIKKYTSAQITGAVDREIVDCADDNNNNNLPSFHPSGGGTLRKIDISMFAPPGAIFTIGSISSSYFPIEPLIDLLNFKYFSREVYGSLCSAIREQKVAIDLMPPRHKQKAIDALKLSNTFHRVCRLFHMIVFDLLRQPRNRDMDADGDDAIREHFMQIKRQHGQSSVEKTRQIIDSVFDNAPKEFRECLHMLLMLSRSLNLDFYSSSNNNNNTDDENQQRGYGNYIVAINDLFPAINLIFSSTCSTNLQKLHAAIFIVDFLRGRDDYVALVVEHVQPQLGTLSILLSEIDSFLSNPSPPLKSIVMMKTSCDSTNPMMITAKEAAYLNERLLYRIEIFSTILDIFASIAYIDRPWARFVVIELDLLGRVLPNTLRFLKSQCLPIFTASNEERAAWKNNNETDEIVMDVHFRAAHVMHSACSILQAVSLHGFGKNIQELHETTKSSSQVDEDVASSGSQHQHNNDDAPPIMMTPFLNSFTKLALECFIGLRKRASDFAKFTAIPHYQYVDVLFDMLSTMADVSSVLSQRGRNHHHQNDDRMTVSEIHESLDKIRYLSRPVLSSTSRRRKSGSSSTDGGCGLLQITFDFMNDFLNILELETRNAPSKTRRYMDPSSLEVLRPGIHLVSSLVRKEAACVTQLAVMEKSHDDRNITSEYEDQNASSPGSSEVNVTLLELMSLGGFRDADGNMYPGEDDSAKLVLDKLKAGFSRFGIDCSDIDYLLDFF